MNKDLVVINTAQFGYHIDSYKYCKYLKDNYSITLVCFDDGRKKIEMAGINIIYVPWKGSYGYRGITYLIACLKIIKSKKVDVIFVVYFPFVSLLKVLSSNQNMILDIRTGDVGGNRIKKNITNSFIRFESQFFNKISIVSESLAIKLKLNMSKVYILPLGSDIISTKNKSFSSLKLFYIGVFGARNIHESIYGLKLFLDRFNNKIEITYDIVGDGADKWIFLLNKAIQDTGLQKIVVLHGRKPHSELQYYLDNCNVGISYIPMTDYYDCQPPTKTFEYISAGMAIIATETSENSRVINSDNGVLCADTPESFANAIHFIHKNRIIYNSDKIRKTLKKNNWENIVKNRLMPILRSFD